MKKLFLWSCLLILLRGELQATTCKEIGICCCNPTKKTLCCLSKQILNNVNTLKKQLACCCSTLEGKLAALTPCGPVIPITQADLPVNATRSAYYCAKEDLFFDGSTINSPGAEGPIAIAVNAPNSVIDLNNHTLYIKGSATNGIATLGNGTHVLIKNGTIVGSTGAEEAGVLILTSNVTVSNVRIINVNGPLGSGIFIQGAVYPQPTTPTILFTEIDDIVIEKCDLENNFFGITLNTFSNSVFIKNCTINQSVQMGITQPARKNAAANVMIDNCTISNSGLNGIYTTYFQTNWSITNCTISNSALNGMILAAFQNLTIKDCKINECGAHGIIASIRQSQNIEIDHCQIFNCQDSALRVDNTENLVVRNCQITNYISNGSPLLKVQDIFNGTLSGCRLNSVTNSTNTNGPDAFFVRNCHGMTIENCSAQIFCNQPQTNCPIGFNLQGNVEGTVLRNCSVSGNPSIGIALQPDTLNGTDAGVVIENCLVKGAVNQGILFSRATLCALYNSQIINGQGDGILLDAQTTQSSIRANTVMGNIGIGIHNLGDTTNKIYANFAQGNGSSYEGVLFVTPPTNTVGAINNIDN